MRRTTLVIAVILAVIVAAAGTAFYVFATLDSIVQAAIEEFGSRAVGTDVSLDAVEIDAASGRGALRGLRVANPPGFAPGDALSIDETSIVIDLKSLAGDTVVVRDVAVRAPRFNYILGPDGANFDRIFENLRGSGGNGQAAAGESGADPGGEPAADGQGRRMVVQRLVIEGGTVSVTAAQLGSEGMAFSLPTLEIRDLGTEERGLTTAALLGRIMVSLRQSADAEIAKIPKLRTILSAPVTEPVKKALQGTGKTLESLGDRLDDLFNK